MQAIVLSKGDVIEKENILLRKNELHKTDFNLVGSNTTIEELEKQHIQMVLEKVDWDIKSACNILGISKATIYRKIDLYKLKKEL